jgi:hypothetical protein
MILNLFCQIDILLYKDLNMILNYLCFKILHLFNYDLDLTNENKHWHQKLVSSRVSTDLCVGSGPYHKTKFGRSDQQDY